MPNDEASEALIDRALGIEGSEADELTPPPDENEGDVGEPGSEDDSEETPEKTGESGDVDEPELDPKSKAFLAWAESDPEGAEAYLAHLDEKEAAKAKPAGKSDATPVVDEAELILQQKVDYQAHVEDRVEDFQDYRRQFSAERDAYEADRQQYNLLAEEHGADHPLIVKEANRLREWNQHLVNAKSEMENKAMYLRRASQIEKEVDAYPRFQPHRIVYAELRLNGTIKGTEPVARRQELLNAELIKRGQKAIGSTGKPAADRRELLKKFQKKVGINLGRQGGGAGGGKPKGEAKPKAIGSTGNPLADKALENI